MKETTKCSRKKSASTTTRKGTPRKKSSARQKGGGREVSPWVIWTATVLVAVGYLVVVYLFFFRPYMDGKQEAELDFLRPQVHGLDISHHQGHIDWEKLSLAAYKDYPINFVFMKATEGSDFVDNAFRQNFATARDCGLIRGAYHFYLPEVDAVLQAENFIRQVRLEPGDLPPVLDVEVAGKEGSAALQQGVRTWLLRVEQHYGVKPIIYASYKFKLKHLNTPFFDAYPYWIAHYYVNKLEYKGAWKFWQHTDMGRIEGVDGEVDLDIFNGNLEELVGFTIRQRSGETVNVNHP